MTNSLPKPTSAFIGASWSALFLGVIAYFIGLFNADIGLGEKGYYVILMFYGLFSVVSLQKTVRDRQEDVPVTDIYYGVAWTAVITALALMAIGLWNATFTLSEKGFYGMAYALSLFAAITVQKNIRDSKVIDELEGGSMVKKGRSWFKSDVSSPSETVDSVAMTDGPSEPDTKLNK